MILVLPWEYDRIATLSQVRNLCASGILGLYQVETDTYLEQLFSSGTALPRLAPYFQDYLHTQLKMVKYTDTEDTVSSRKFHVLKVRRMNDGIAEIGYAGAKCWHAKALAHGP